MPNTQRQAAPESLPHDVDLSPFSGLTGDQIYFLFDYLGRLTEGTGAAGPPRGGAVGRERLSDLPGETWAPAAFHVNAHCPTRQPLTPDELRLAFGAWVRAGGDEAARSWNFSHDYSLLTQVFSDAWITFMNYGFDDFSFDARPLPLAPGSPEARWRPSAQLYHHVAAPFAPGRAALEIGCGRGGGAAYVHRELGTRSYLGFDGTRTNVKFCDRHHRAPGLSFAYGDVTALPVGDGAVGLVLMVESGRSYDLDRFAPEVRRALEPGGHFVVATYSTAEETWRRRGAFLRAGLRVVREEDLSYGVKRALTGYLNGGLWGVVAASATALPKSAYMHHFNRTYAVKGLLDGTLQYCALAFRKPA